MTAKPIGGEVMPEMACDSAKRSELSWEFLSSEFARAPYASRPIEGRLDAFLRHHQLHGIIDDASAYDGLLDCVMANIGPALRSGILGGDASHGDHGAASAGIESWSE